MQAEGWRQILRKEKHTVAVANRGSACMTYTPQCLNSRSVKGVPLSRTCPVTVPLPRALPAKAFSCDRQINGILGREVSSRWVQISE